MGLSNYPPGVTGNEPQISGIWPAEQVVDDAVDSLNKMSNDLDELVLELEDQGLFSPDAEKHVEALENHFQGLKDELLSMVAEEPND